MSDMPESTPTGPLQPAPAPPRRRGGFLGRLIAAFLVVIITTFLVLVVVAVVLLQLGFSPETPQQLADTRARLDTAQALNDTLRLQNSAMQTQVIDLTRRSDDDRETLSALQQQIGNLDQLRQEFAAGASQNATLVAEARASRDSVTLFVTAEAGRAALLDELKRRSDRIERFLQRLSDISSDTALDLSAGTPTAPIAPPVAPSPALTPTSLPATSAPTATPTSTPTPRTPSGTPRASATPAASPTASL